MYLEPYWVAVKELEASYQNSDIILFSIHPHYGNFDQVPYQQLSLGYSKDAGAEPGIWSCPGLPAACSSPSAQSLRFLMPIGLVLELEMSDARRPLQVYGLVFGTRGS